MPAATITEDAVRVHVSQIAAYQTCPRMCYFAHVVGLVPKVESPKLLFGKGIHIGLAAYYDTGQRSAAVDAYRTWLLEEEHRLTELGANLEHLKEAAEIGELLLNAYLDYADQNDDFVTVAVEQPFVVPIWAPLGDGTLRHYTFMGKPVYHEGTFDGVVRNKYGKLWLMEHKTASSFPSSQMLRVDFQVSFYMLAAQQLYEEEVCGVVYNVIRKVHPKRARTEVIRREYVSRSAHELKVSVGHLYRATRRMLLDRTYDPTPGHHCSWKCAYWQLCLCMQDGTDYMTIANSLYERRDDSSELGEGVEEELA